MKEMQTLVQTLPYLAPLLVLGVVLLAVALVDLAKREHVMGGNKVIWILVMVSIQVIGPIIYMVVGRKERHDEGD